MVVLPKLLYFERNSSSPQYTRIVEVKTIRQYVIHVDITLKAQLQKPSNMIYNYLKYYPLFFLSIANKHKLHMKKENLGAK